MSKLDIDYNITQLFKYCGDYIIAGHLSRIVQAI